MKGLNELVRSVVELREVGFEVPIPEVLRVAADWLLTVQAAREQLTALSLPDLVTEIPKTEAIALGMMAPAVFARSYREAHLAVAPAGILTLQSSTTHQLSQQVDR